jgi:hypothetical protein
MSPDRLIGMRPRVNRVSSCRSKAALKVEEFDFGPSKVIVILGRSVRSWYLPLAAWRDLAAH